MSRRMLAGLAAMFGIALAVSVVAQVWMLPAVVRDVAGTFPETEPLVGPAIVWGAVAIACLQAAGVLALRIIGLSAAGRFGPPRFRLLWGVVACLVVFVALVATAVWVLTALQYATPGVMLTLLAAGVAAAVAAVAVLLYVGGRLQARAA